MKYFYFLFIFLFFLSGCSTIKPSITEYKIVLDTKKLLTRSTGCKDKSLKVSQAFSSSTFMSLKMNYVQDKYKVYEYSQAQWSNPLNQEISSSIVNAIKDTKLFKSTQTYKSRSKSNLILEINIKDFMQYFNKDATKSYVNVKIDLALVDAKSSDVIATKTFSSKVNIDSLNAAGGVNGLGLALENVLEDAIKFLEEVCK